MSTNPKPLSSLTQAIVDVICKTVVVERKAQERLHGALVDVSPAIDQLKTAHEKLDQEVKALEKKLGEHEHYIRQVKGSYVSNPGEAA